ncbi:hypothetical protein [Paraflavitalea pollutisoli]|uniref:hypothetical protein n=1 Tax=Paraflavitalea pollutisoli TaxID=3034143 RepID=UPI0023EE28CC|nr:hypothetical protein [Paraflavitalea sp. H1-2-19X]
MKKLICLALLLATVRLTQAQTPQPSTLPNYLSYPAGTFTLPLHWKGDSLHQQWEPQASLLIPVSLPGCTRTLYMQFDTGSPYTLLYRQPLQAVHRLFPKTSYGKNLTDTLYQFGFKAGKLPLTAQKIAVINHGDSIIAPNEPLIIGTIGTDLIDHKVVTLDYQHLQLTISDSLPANWQAHQARAFHYAMRRILLPANLSGKQTILYFDSGSSAFPLLIDKATCHQLAIDSTRQTSYPVQSWGRTLTAHTFDTRDSISLAGLRLPIRQVTWIEGANAGQAQQMMRMGIGGMTGNKLLLHHRLVLDTRAKIFMVY